MLLIILHSSIADMHIVDQEVLVLGPQPGFLTVPNSLVAVMHIPDSRSQPGMGYSRYSVPEINTGGERRMQNPHAKQA